MERASMTLKIRATYETEVYTTQAGYVAIKQEDPVDREDSVVLLSADQLAVVISELQGLLDAREEWEGELTERTDDEAESAT
jgi:hypothetical protein